MGSVDKLVAIRIQQGSSFYEIPICALTSNVYYNYNGDGQSHNWSVQNLPKLIDVIGDIPLNTDGTVKKDIQTQLNELFNNKADTIQFNKYVDQRTHAQIQEWLERHVTVPNKDVDVCVLVDSSLTISGQAADAAKTGELVTGLREDIGIVKKNASGQVISLQSQIDTKISEEDIQNYVDNNIAEQVSNWLNQFKEELNIPIEYAILVDSQLKTSGQAADAKVTGDKFKELQDNLQDQIGTFYPSATAENIGNVLKAKTITDGRISEWELGLPESTNGFNWNLLNNTASLSENDISVYSRISHTPKITMNKGILTIYARNNGHNSSQWVLYKTNLSRKDALNGTYAFSFEMRNFSSYNDTQLLPQDFLGGNIEFKYGYKSDLTESRNVDNVFNTDYDYFYDGSDDNHDGIMDNIIINEKNTDWKKYYIIIEVPEKLDTGSQLSLNSDSVFCIAFKLDGIVQQSKYGYSVQFKNFKLEEGFLSTQWTPSVVDLQLTPEEQKHIYTHIKYCNNPTDSNQGLSQSGGSYVGFYYDENESDSSNKNDYTWVNVEGDINGDNRGFTWNRLKEDDIAISNIGHPGLDYDYLGKGWFTINSQSGPIPDSSVNLISVPLYFNENGLIPSYQGGDFTLSLEMEGNLFRINDSAISTSNLYLKYQNKRNSNDTYQDSPVWQDGKISISNEALANYNLIEIGHRYNPNVNGGYNIRIRFMLAPGGNYFRSWTPAQTDLYGCRVSLSTESYVFPKISENISVSTKVLAYKGNELIPTNVLFSSISSLLDNSLSGSLPDGMTITISNNNSTETELEITVAPSMPSVHGTIIIPTIVNYQRYELTFTYSIAKQGVDNIYYCEGSDENSEVTNSTKTISCNNTFSQYTSGMLFLINFQKGNQKINGDNHLYLNIEGKSAQVYFNNLPVSSNNQFCWADNTKILFMYDEDHLTPVGYPNTYYGICSTNAANNNSNPPKECLINNFVLCKGTNVIINFDNATVDPSATQSLTPTLNISSTGVYNIKVGNSNLTQKYFWNSKSTVSFIFNGKQFEINNTSLYDKTHQVIYHTGSINNFPSGTTVGDILINTQNGNQISYWNNNRWQPLSFSAGAITDGGITAQKLANLTFVAKDDTTNVNAGSVKGTSSLNGNYINLNIEKYKSERYSNINDKTLTTFETGIEIKDGKISSLKKGNFFINNEDMHFGKYSGVGLNNGQIEFNIPYPTKDNNNNDILPQVEIKDNEYFLKSDTTKTAYINYVAPIDNNVYSPRLTIGTDDPVYIGTVDTDLTAKFSKEDSLISSSLAVYGDINARGNIELYPKINNTTARSVYIDFHIPRADGTTASDFDARIISNYEGNYSTNPVSQKLTEPQLQLELRKPDSDYKAGGRYIFKNGGIELYPSTKGKRQSTSTFGRSYIDFHWNSDYNVDSGKQPTNGGSDYSSRISETSSGVITINPNLTVANDIRYGNTCSQSSDERLKKNIINMDNKYLSLLDALESKQFRFKNNDEKLSVGFIAQDVLKKIDEIGIEDQSFVLETEYEDGNRYYSINYIGFIPILIKKCQQQDKKIRELEEKINNIKRYEQ